MAPPTSTTLESLRKSKAMDATLQDQRDTRFQEYIEILNYIQEHHLQNVHNMYAALGREPPKAALVTYRLTGPNAHLTLQSIDSAPPQPVASAQPAPPAQPALSAQSGLPAQPAASSGRGRPRTRFHPFPGRAAQYHPFQSHAQPPTPPASVYADAGSANHHHGPSQPYSHAPTRPTAAPMPIATDPRLMFASNQTSTQAQQTPPVMVSGSPNMQFQREEQANAAAMEALSSRSRTTMDNHRSFTPVSSSAAPTRPQTPNLSSSPTPFQPTTPPSSQPSPRQNQDQYALPPAVCPCCDENPFLFSGTTDVVLAADHFHTSPLTHVAPARPCSNTAAHCFIPHRVCHTCHARGLAHLKATQPSLFRRNYVPLCQYCANEAITRNKSRNGGYPEECVCLRGAHEMGDLQDWLCYECRETALMQGREKCVAEMEGKGLERVCRCGNAVEGSLGRQGEVQKVWMCVGCEGVKLEN